MINFIDICCCGFCVLLAFAFIFLVFLCVCVLLCLL